MTETDRPVEKVQAYFEVIETVFVRLRGAPLLLSPADWQVAREWFEAGIPLDLVRQTLESVFARRKERGARGRIQSLRYCADSVWQAWDQTRELEAGGVRQTVATMNVQARLSGISGSLPEELSDREEWVERIEGLSGTSAEVENSLAELDAQLLAAVERSLNGPDRERLTARVDAVIAGLQARLPEEEIGSARDRIRRGSLRELAQLPLLSLFSTEALSADRGLVS
ncbi:MAG: hypothetical protein WBO74_00930 [Thermoanaerobaculia bacterium]